MVAGFVVAVVTLLLFSIVIPHIQVRGTIRADAPLGERFSENLRIVKAPAMASDGGAEHGTIFTSERKMTTNSSGRPKAGASRQVPSIARDRSRAKAGISQRAAYRVRGILAAVALAVVTVVAWVVVGFTSVPAAVAIAATVVTGVFVLGLSYKVTEWAKADDADIATIERANKILSSAKRRQKTAAKQVVAKTAAAKPVAAKPVATKRVGKQKSLPEGHEEVVAESADKASAPSVNADVTAPVVAQPATAPAEVSESSAAPASAPKEQPVAKATVTKKASVATPSYTLKPAIKKRTVKPYEPPVEDSGAVPYRPKRIAERLGDGRLESANPAPEMTGQEETRMDLLGGGSTLDKLLDQRRA